MVKVKVAGESLYTFEGLSSKITDQSLHLILPQLIVRQRAKRELAALRKIERAEKKERKAQREQILLESGMNVEEYTQKAQRQVEEEANRWLRLHEAPTKKLQEKDDDK